MEKSPRILALDNMRKRIIEMELAEWGRMLEKTMQDYKVNFFFLPQRFSRQTNIMCSEKKVLANCVEWGWMAMKKRRGEMCVFSKWNEFLLCTRSDKLIQEGSGGPF